MTPSQEALSAAVKAEHAAIYLYGVIDAYAAPTRKADIATMTAEHRAQRDSLIGVLTSSGAEVPPAAPGYTPPEPIVDPVSAAEVAAAVEDDCAAAYRNLLTQADGDGVRHLGVTGIGGAAVRGARWRVALDVSPVGPPFPGIRT